ncbi:hypothetical protein DFA_01914 [Cavenderia fasciculata]|uniref:Uncharacterized protein n=1 Tax=Cavenderia fasciculata TaxID=261658 RepID=F4PQR7_CACFS|nr:uncharacterized protein DFA_01914 [Cavenderia fasciculata]EGG22025.1 hypothetical protein DFA_01914 [Cavenderia fasciculata]|eukprot:XP_004359876.1 hypothetical protein DFA_01914 [Cavenderia fasciculata]
MSFYYSLIKHILNNKQLRVIIFQHVTSIHRQLAVKTAKSKDLESLRDYIKYGRTDLFIKHFDRFHQLILMVDQQSKRYKKINNHIHLSFLKNNYIKRLYWVFDIVFEKNNHVAMKYLIDRLGITKKDFQSYRPHFTTSLYQFTTEMFYVLRDANFSTLVPSLQNAMINVLIKLGGCDQLESYLSKLYNPNPSSPSPSRHPFKNSFSSLLSNNNNKEEMIYTLQMIDIFKRYSINVIEDVLIGAVENNHLEMIKWIVENVPEKKLIEICLDLDIFRVLEEHGKKEVLEMLPIPENPPYGLGGSGKGNLDYMEYFLQISRRGHIRVIGLLVQNLAYGRLDAIELILSNYQEQLRQDQTFNDQLVIDNIDPKCFSVGLVTRLIDLGFKVPLFDSFLETVIQDNQLDTLIELDPPALKLPLRVQNFTRLLGYAIECNSLSSIDILLHHPRFQEFQDHTTTTTTTLTIDISCIKPQSVPTIEYLFSLSTIPVIKFNCDFSLSINYMAAVDYESVSKVIRLVYRPNIIDHCQLVGIFVLANDIEWLFDHNIITNETRSGLFGGSNHSIFTCILAIACRNGNYKALDFLFDNCLSIQVNDHLSLTSLARLPDDQQFERFWKKIVITDARTAVTVAHIIIRIILLPKEVCNPKRAKFIADIYGTFLLNPYHQINPIRGPSIMYLEDNHPFAHYPTLMEVFCSDQKVGWINSYSFADQLKIFQKAISFGYILPIPSF